MIRTLLLRGMLVGLVAGLLAFGFAKIVGEPQVDKAIAFESAMDAAKGEPPEPELVSRHVQSTVGLLTGVVTYGTAFGGLFALVFASLVGRVGRLDPRALSALLALGGFLAIVVVPDLKYPANPPSVGNPDTIGFRTGLFFTMMAISIGCLVAAIAAARNLRRRFGAWNAGILAGAGFIIVIALVQHFLPDINEVPATFPAAVLWRFRLASLGIEAVLWTGLGLGFGWLTERSLQHRFGLLARA